MIGVNPFSKLKGANVGNTARQFFVTRDMTTAILNACPDAQWRLIVALARYGGLRIPSEIIHLRLGDVDWDAGKIRISSPKTEHHEGSAERFISLFPELRPHLESVWHSAPRRRHTLYHPVRRRNAKPANNVREDYSPRWTETLAQVVSKLPK